MQFNINKKILTSILEKGLRFYVFTLVNIYGFSKLLYGQFYVRGKLPAKVVQKSIDQLSGFELAWTFFGYSRIYVFFIGFSQVIGAFMLLSERTKMFGVAILIPILVNIIIVDYTYEINTGAMMSAISYLLSLIIVAIMNRDRVVKVFAAFFALHPERQRLKLWERLLYWGAAVVVAAAVFYLDFKLRSSITNSK